MSAVAERTRSERRESASSGGPLTGTGRLLRFMLRRDRVRFPVWVLAVSIMAAYFSNVIALVMDEEALNAMTAFAANPIMGLIGGPGFGFDAITVPRFVVGMYGTSLMLGAAFMSITTISRHTRVEEQTGRAELIRANVVGRHAPLAAALVVAALMNIVMALLTGLTMMSSAAEPAPAGSLLFGAGLGAAGLAFAGVAAVTVQLSPFSRAASGFAGLVLGVSFVVRGLGDMSAVQNGDLAWLSWLSPLGWPQQTAPFTNDDWWPLLLGVALFALLVALAFALQSRRDLAAGILPDRLGRAAAPGWLRGPLSLAYRLQRPSIAGWSIAMLMGGVTFGAFTRPMADGAEGMPEQIVGLMGGAEGIVEGYVGFMGVYFAMMVAAFAIISVQSLRAEEQGVRTEAVLATGVGRSAWLLSWTFVTAIGSLWLLALAGVGEGIGAAAGMNDWSMFWPVAFGHAAQVPAVWLLLGLSVGLYGVSPRILGLAWAVFIVGALLSLFGDMLDLDDVVLSASPFRHVGEYPAENVSWAGIAVLTGIGAVCAALGAIVFRRRDLTTA